MSGRALFPSRIAAALAICLCGCAIVGERYVLEEPFTDDHVRRIRHWETTKREILEWLGPPAAMDNDAQGFPSRGGSASVPLVYQYRASEIAFADFCAFGQGGGGCINTAPVLKTRILRILIDEKTQRVMDHSLEETEREESDKGVVPWLR